ncbi:site-specific DNA-methyltransferase [Campylobacter concisus]|uniref:site-specific DNA-methyltransferase n=1 Tax=Campylobacter concisus TaxID=199 RepID=UPI000CD812E2|nr:site-specific DNA-methyltransferase [Campylobacter concisus]
MDKMKMETADIAAQNIEKIGALFPNCITEMLDEEKSTAENKVYKKAINFELLKQMLSKEVIDGNEAYEFTWVGKKASIVEANKPIRKTLRPCKDESVNWDDTQNLYIEGDNLEVLKLLQESYLGKVKMIYIDPPYNTGNDFIYNDDFKMSSDEYADKSGETDEEGNRMFKNTDSNGRFHSDWCSMIYPRLLLARNLLSDDGVIFISIDDNEQANLKKICDEVFGMQNFVASLIWQKKTGASDSKGIANITESILVYAKEKKFYASTFTKNNSSYDLSRYRYTDEFIDERGPYYIDNLDRGGLSYSDSLNYGVECPDGTIAFPNGRSEYINDGWIWKWNKKKIEWARKNKFIEFRKTDKKKNGWAVCYKNYLKVDNENNPIERAAPHKNLITDILNANASATMKDLFNTNNYFNYSKPIELIGKIIGFVQCNNAILLDFFSGSSTTAHAVMQLNAQDGGNRKFIMVQLPEKTDETSEAYKAGYKNICEIGKERIRRAGKKILEENKDKEGIENLDTGFRVLKLDDTNMRDVYYSPSKYSQNLLSALESNVKPDRSDLDLLFGCLLEWGLPLSLPYSCEKIGECTVHNYNDGDLIACFDENIAESVIKEIAKKRPLRAVFRDSSFANSPSKINVAEIFKLLAPDTRVKVI